MSKITSKFVVYPSDSDYYKLRHLKKFRNVTLSGSPKSKAFKKSIASLRTPKSVQTVKFQNVECISPKTFSFLARLFYKSFKAIKKLVFESGSHGFLLQRKIFALKKIFKNISQVQTLAMTSVSTNNIKYCRSLQNIKLSLPETAPSTSIVPQIRHLRNLQQAEVCISNEEQALPLLKEVHRIKSKHCKLDITLMKLFWSISSDHLETFSQQTLKKVASIELNLASLPATPIDNDTLQAHSKFLKFLYEPVGSSQRRRRRKPVECIKFPGMKLQIDSNEYNSPPKIYSLLESFLSVYDSSVLHVKEYSPENNFAKLYFELTSWASSWEIYELLKDIIEFKDIKFLHLELDVQGMTELEFRNIIEKICKIEKLQFLSVASGRFSFEVQQPHEVSLNGGISSGIRHMMVETRS